MLRPLSEIYEENKKIKEKIESELKNVLELIKNQIKENPFQDKYEIVYDPDPICYYKKDSELIKQNIEKFKSEYEKQKIIIYDYKDKYKFEFIPESENTELKTLDNLQGYYKLNIKKYRAMNEVIRKVHEELVKKIELNEKPFEIEIPSTEENLKYIIGSGITELFEICKTKDISSVWEINNYVLFRFEEPTTNK